METFFKRVGIGAIVIITSPLWLVYFCLYVVFGAVMIVLTPIRFIASLFSDNKLKIKNHYDKEAAAILNQAEEAKARGVTPSNVNNVPPNNYYPYNQNNNYPPQPPYYPPQNNYPSNGNPNYNNNYHNYPNSDGNNQGGNR